MQHLVKKSVMDFYLKRRQSHRGKKRPEMWPIPSGLNFKHEKDRKLSFEPSLIGTFQGECVSIRCNLKTAKNLFLVGNSFSSINMLEHDL